MTIQPVFEKQASEETREIYEHIESALESQTLPVFFAYLGAFPEYLTYISDSLIQNLEDPKFQNMTQRLTNDMIPLINEKLKKSSKLSEWINHYQYSPSFYHFQKDISNIFLLNLKLAFIFIALREAVKGWAVAAKRLTSSILREQKKADFVREDFVFDQTLMQEFTINERPEQLPPATNQTQQALVKSQPFSIEKDPMQEYFNLCRIDFVSHMKSNTFWAVRIGLEKMILVSLPLFPKLIHSPINMVIKLTEKYPEFPDLIYLLAEHFPTASVQRLMFSGYMKI